MSSACIHADTSSRAEIAISEALKALIDEHGLDDGNGFACGEIAARLKRRPSWVGRYVRHYDDGIAARLSGLLSQPVQLRLTYSGTLIYCRVEKAA